MFVVKYRKLFFTISILLVLASLWAIFSYGLKLGTDFRGGTIMELEYATSTVPVATAISESLQSLNLGNVAIQPTGESGMILRLRHITEPEHQAVIAALQATGVFSETRYSTVGPALGAELARKGVVAVILVAILIILYIALVFRRVSRPVSSWKYGVVAVIALCHDVIIPIGVFAVLGKFYGVEVDALFLTALLTILGLSVNDTIVVFDRVRENLKHHGAANFVETVGNSIRQTFARSFNTSLTIIIVLLAIVWFGSESTRWFALALTIGMAVGTYSSIFLAAPLLIAWNSLKR